MTKQHYEAKINYLNTRNRGLLAENERLEKELADARQYIKFTTYTLIIIMILSVLGILASVFNG